MTANYTEAYNTGMQKWSKHGPISKKKITWEIHHFPVTACIKWGWGQFVCHVVCNNSP